MCRSPNHSALSDTSVICCAGQCPVTPPPTKLLYSPLGSLADVKWVESEFGVMIRSHCPDGAAPGGGGLTDVGAPGGGGGAGGRVGCCAASGAASAQNASIAIRETRERTRVLIAGGRAPAAEADPDR